MNNVVSRYASLVKFSHTVFAMPFALLSYVYALVSTAVPFDWLLLVKILLCMVFARNAAMGFNRWADRDIDAKNPRTAGREIPAGKITPRAALAFVIGNCVAFVAAAAWINCLALWLSPVALAVLLGYSLTKRFTAWSHVVLGLALAIAPEGAYIAVTGSIALFPMLLAVAVLTWTAGFDILYSLQDASLTAATGCIPSLHASPPCTPRSSVSCCMCLPWQPSRCSVHFTASASGIGWDSGFLRRYSSCSMCFTVPRASTG